MKAKKTDISRSNAQVSFGARQARTQNNVKSPSDDSRGSSFDGSYGTADPEEAKTQKRAQQKAYSRRITTLRNIVTENHGKLINGQDLTQYKIPAENLSMEGHYGEKYTRLADAYNSQILLRERLSALGNVNDRKAIIDEVKKWDVRNDELYVKQVTSSHQQVNERSKQQTVRRPSVRNPFGLAPANASESPLTAQRASHPAPTFNLPSFERTSDVPNTSRAGRAPADGYPGSPRSIARTTADQAKNTNPLARLPSNPAGDYTIPALGAATSVSGIAKMKRIRIRLRLPEDDKSASRYMFWSQPLSRDEFFRQVSERFPNHSVQFVETVLDSDGILVEPTGSEDEWEIMQEELSRILEQSLTEKLQVDVVVHLG